MVDNRTTIREAIERASLLRFVRSRFEAPGAHLVGVPVAVGSQWVVVARMDDAIRLDGFDALRMSDLTEVNLTFQSRSFYCRALRWKRARVSSQSGLQLTSARAVLHSVQRSHALIVIEREATQMDGADIGRIVRFSTRSCSLRSMSPSAEWNRSPEIVLYADVTRVGFGGEYEETLAAVGGLPDPRWQ